MISFGKKCIGKRHKPLYVTADGLITHKKNSIYLYDGFKFNFLFSLPRRMIDKICIRSRFLERLLRLEPIHLNLFDDEYVFTMHDCILIYKTNLKKFVKINFRNKKIHTNMVVSINNIFGFDDCLAYGEYWGNGSRQAVNIMVRTKGESEFKCAYSFPDKTIRHIHSLIPDSKNNCVYVLTGDGDSESGIWKATNNFSKIEPLFVGNQNYRAVIAYLVDNDLYYSTDFPSSQNFLYKICGKEVEEVCKLCGPCTTGSQTPNGFIISSSVETKEPNNSSKISLIKYMLSRKKADGIYDDMSRLYYFDKRDKTTKILAELKKDFLPAGSFRFGRVISLYDKYRNMVYFYPMALKKIDAKLYAVLEGKLND